MVEGENHKRKKTALILKRVLVSVLIFILLDLAAGLVLIRDNFQSFRTESRYYHHGLLPNRETMAAWGSLVYPFYTNSMGFVDSAAYHVQRETENERILILGDSHSEGVGVPYLKTFAGRLSSMLKKHDVEVLNASCISYSQKIEYLKAKYIIEEQGLGFDHLFVLVDISDMQNELVYEHFEPAESNLFSDGLFSIKSFLRRHSAIYHLLYSYFQNRNSKSFFDTAQLFEESGTGEPPSNSLELYATFFSDFDDNTLLSNPQFHGVSEWYYDDYFRELADTGIGMAQEYVLKLKSLCEDHDIKLTISVHPWQTQIMKGNSEDYYTRKWGDFCQENGIGFVNLFPLFINGQNPVLVNKMYYIVNDNHWNEFGHEKVAGYLQEYFEEHLLAGGSK